MKINPTAAWQTHIQIRRAATVAKLSIRTVPNTGLRLLGQRLLEAAAGDAPGEAAITGDRKLRTEWTRERPVEPNDGDERSGPACGQFAFSKDQHVEITG
jgi:hypothetical protein